MQTLRAVVKTFAAAPLDAIAEPYKAVIIRGFKFMGKTTLAGELVKMATDENVAGASSRQHHAFLLFSDRRPSSFSLPPTTLPDSCSLAHLSVGLLSFSSLSLPPSLPGPCLSAHIEHQSSTAPWRSMSPTM
jgi:hypothetical protein